MVNNMEKDCWNCKRSYDGSPKPCKYAKSCFPATFGVFSIKSGIDTYWIASMPEFEDRK